MTPATQPGACGSHSSAPTSTSAPRGSQTTARRTWSKSAWKRRRRSSKGPAPSSGPPSMMRRVGSPPVWESMMCMNDRITDRRGGLAPQGACHRLLHILRAETGDRHLKVPVPSPRCCPLCGTIGKTAIKTTTMRITGDLTRRAFTLLALACPLAVQAGVLQVTGMGEESVAPKFVLADDGHLQHVRLDRERTGEGEQGECPAGQVSSDAHCCRFYGCFADCPTKRAAPGTGDWHLQVPVTGFGAQNM